MNAQETKKILKEYIENSGNKQAILINGDWGSGKTYFVNELCEDKKFIDENLAIYISLYGIENISKIDEEMSLEFYSKANIISKVINKDINKNLVGISNKLFKKIIFQNVNNKLGIDIQKCFDEYKKYKNCVIVFDDLERCSLEISNILGYINNLVEHNGCKVIIIANEDEIGKKYILKNLPEKYMASLMLNQKLAILKESGEEKEKNTEKNNIDRLNDFTDKLFKQKTIYNEIKEKLIGLTIEYKPNISEIINRIIKENSDNKEAETILLDSKRDIIDILDKQNCSNIRTLKFIITRYYKLFKVLDKLKNIDSDILENEYKNILKYMVNCAVIIKKGKELCIGNEKKICTLFIDERGNFTNDSICSNKIVGYGFVDRLLKSHHLDEKDIEDVMRFRIDELLIQKNIDRDLVYAHHLNNLKEWYWNLESEEEIGKSLDKVCEGLDAKKYTVFEFCNIIDPIRKLEKEGFSLPNKYNNYTNLYKRIEKSMIEYVKSEEFKKYYDNDNYNDLFNKITFFKEEGWYSKTIISVLDEIKKIYNSKAQLDILFDNSSLDELKKNEAYYIESKKFLYYIEPNDFIKRVNELKNLEITNLYKKIAYMYEYNPVDRRAYRYFNDIQNIEKILKKLDVDKISNGEFIRKYRLNRVKGMLEEIKNSFS